MYTLTIYSPAEIEAIRKASGLTPTQFAYHCGVSLSAYTHWRKGERTPSIDHMRRIGQLASKNPKRKTS